MTTLAVSGPEPSSATTTSDGPNDCPAIERSVSLSASGQLYVVTMMDDSDMSISLKIHLSINNKNINTCNPFSGHLTLLDAVAKAGGYAKDARLDSVKIVRGDISAPEVVSCDLGSIIKEGNIIKNIDLRNRDVIYIPKSRIANMKMNGFTTTIGKHRSK